MYTDDWQSPTPSEILFYETIIQISHTVDRPYSLMKSHEKNELEIRPVDI